MYREISVVVQGPVDFDLTKRCLASLRKHLPNAEIILSTYAGTDTNGLDYDKLTLTSDNLEIFPYNSEPNAKLNNINRQIATTMAGLCAATRQYVLKLRTDFILTGNMFLSFFDRFPKYDTSYKIFDRKIIIPTIFSRNPRLNPLPFHPSDIAMFGLASDLRNLFDIPFMSAREAKWCWYGLNIAWHNRYVPEQYLWVNCLRKNGKDIQLDYAYENNPQLTRETEKYFVSNFIFLSWKQFNLLPPQKINSLNNFIKNQPYTCVTNVEYQALYKEYLDKDFAVPDRDVEREWVEKQSLKMKTAFHVAQFITLPIFLKKQRRAARESLARWLLARM